MPKREIRILTLLGVALIGRAPVAAAQIPLLPSGSASVYSYANSWATRAPFASLCGLPGEAGFQEAATRASASQSCTVDGPVQSIERGFAPFDVGTVKITGSASFLQGQWLRAAAQTSGTLAPQVAVYNDASATYYDGIVVNGPITRLPLSSRWPFTERSLTPTATTSTPATARWWVPYY